MLYFTFDCFDLDRVLYMSFPNTAPFSVKMMDCKLRSEHFPSFYLDTTCKNMLTQWRRKTEKGKLGTRAPSISTSGFLWHIVKTPYAHRVCQVEYIIKRHIARVKSYCSTPYTVYEEIFSHHQWLVDVYSMSHYLQVLSYIMYTILYYNSWHWKHCELFSVIYSTHTSCVYCILKSLPLVFYFFYFFSSSKSKGNLKVYKRPSHAGQSNLINTLQHLLLKLDVYFGGVELKFKSCFQEIVQNLLLTTTLCREEMHYCTNYCRYTECMEAMML